jgi:peptide/nickel transport system ATP-binding protein
MAGSGTAHLRDVDASLLRVEHLTVEFEVGKNTVHAVSDVSFDVLPGETFGLVGESGCGKSTTGRAIMQLPAPTSGSVRFDGKDLTTLSADELRQVRPRLQMIFQDPLSSLNPRRTIEDVVAEPLVVWGVPAGDDAKTMVDEVLSEVGFDPDAVRGRRPHQFSGGQCQRISIARALVMRPAAIICDEPVSALDVSVQAQVLNLLEDTKARHGLTLVFIAHDLAVVKNISDRVGVMYLGKMCEVAPSDVLYASPAHPYTAALIAAVPSTDSSRQRLASRGEPPSPMAPPSGCRFRTRCPFATERCIVEEPVMREVSTGQFVACHHPL